MATEKTSHKDALHQSMAELFVSGDYSDLTFACGELSKPVHKLMLCKASPVIAAEVKDHWQESTTGIIQHTLFHADTVYKMLEFMYTGQYELNVQPEEKTAVTVQPEEGTQLDDRRAWGFGDTEGDILEEARDEAIAVVRSMQTTSAESTVVIEQGISPANRDLIAHIQVRALADYYNVQRLVEYAENKYQSTIEPDIDPAGFISVIDALCEHVTPGGRLHDVTVSTVHQHLSSLYQDANFSTGLASNQNIQPFCAQLIHFSVQRSSSLVVEGDDQALLTEEPAVFKAMQKQLCAVANARKLRCTHCTNAKNRLPQLGWGVLTNEPDYIQCKHCTSVLHGFP